LGAAFGAWTKRVETTAEFEAALAEATDRPGIRLIHCITDVEQLSASGATVSGLRSKA
jgi:acetolactate synthase-1/2/3 large subunit